MSQNFWIWSTPRLSNKKSKNFGSQKVPQFFWYALERNGNRFLSSLDGFTEAFSEKQINILINYNMINFFLG